MKGWLRRGCILRSLRLAAPWISEVLLAWRFVSESQRALRAQRSVAKARCSDSCERYNEAERSDAMRAVFEVFTAWTVVIREIAEPRICRNSRPIWIKWITYESSHAHSLCLLNVRCILHVFWRHTDLIVDTRAECAFASGFFCLFFFPHHTVQYPSISVQNNIYIYSLLNFV